MKFAVHKFWLFILFVLVNPTQSFADGLEISSSKKVQIVLGKKTAPVTVYMYSALTCGHCADFHNKVLPKIKKYFVDKGKVRIIMRPFPIDGISVEGAKVVFAFPLNDTRLKIQDALFRHQHQWAFSHKEDLAERISVATGLGLHEVQNALANKGLEDKILATALYADKVHGVKASPTFIIGMKSFDYAITYKEFKQAVKPLLDEALGS